MMMSANFVKPFGKNPVFNQASTSRAVVHAQDATFRPEYVVGLCELAGENPSGLAGVRFQKAKTSDVMQQARGECVIERRAKPRRNLFGDRGAGDAMSPAGSDQGADVTDQSSHCHGRSQIPHPVNSQDRHSVPQRSDSCRKAEQGGVR